MMRYFTSTAIACALAGTICVFAQEPPPAQQQQQQQQQQQAPPAATLTGCVQEAKTTDGGTALILNNAEGGTAKMYLLVAQAQSDMSSHVNHKVEVTGQVQEPAPPPTSEEGATAKPNVVRPPVVQVASMQMIAESCK
jgi:hypothetical protein